MNKYKILNLIKDFFGGIVSFLSLPLTLPILFFMTNWEDKNDRESSIKSIKSDISFGFWKH